MAANRAVWLELPFAGEKWGRGQWVGGCVPSTAWEGVTVPRMGSASTGRIKGSELGGGRRKREVGTRIKQLAREGSSLCASTLSPESLLPSFPGVQAE